MFVNEFPISDIKKFWREFAKAKISYTSNERWSEINSKSYKNIDFLNLTCDDLIYQGYCNKFTEEDEKTKVPIVYTGFSFILAKKAIIEYNVEQFIPCYEFDTYFQTTRLMSLFDRTRDVSELREIFEKYENKLIELFPDETTTLSMILLENDKSEKFSDLADNDEFGYDFVDIFTNVLTYDFVKNYLHLNNERNLNDIYRDNTYTEEVIQTVTTTDKNGYDYDGVCDEDEDDYNREEVMCNPMQC